MTHATKGRRRAAKRFSLLKGLSALLLVLFLTASLATTADAQSISRTDWQMNNGGSWVSLGFTNPQHGMANLYGSMNIPAANDPNWGLPPVDANGNIYYSVNSILPGWGCRSTADFTYFQTFVTVPANATISTFTVSYDQVDDGARAYVFNSAHPGGAYDPNGDIRLGGPAVTADLAQFVAIGEVNRVVIVQVDDCPSGNNLRNAQLVLNGTVVPTNTPPDAVAATGSATLECQGPSGTSVSLDGSGSSDVDGDALTYTWSDADGDVIATGETASVDLALGTHVITLTVDDGNGGTDSGEVTVTIKDTLPPVVSLSGAPIILWPPNHKYHTIDIGSVVSVSDQCSGDLGTGWIASVSSDEPEETAGGSNGKGKGPRGGGDANTKDDIVIGSCTSADLRAERLGGGNGRVYVVNVAALDAQSNGTTAAFEVHVPHDQDVPGTLSVKDAPIYSVDAPAACAAVPGQSSARTASLEKDALKLDMSTSSQMTAGAADALRAGELPTSFAMEQNYPNPFNPTTSVDFALPEAAHVVIRVYNVVGQQVDVLMDGSLSAGRHTVRFDAGHLSNGVYIYTMEAGNFKSVRRMVLMK